MFCCSNCFIDTELKAIINANKKTGTCDFCGSHDHFVYEIGADDTLSELFDGIIDIYTPLSSLPSDFPREKADLIKNILLNNWNIFNLKPDTVYRLITQICSERYHDQPDLFDNPVAIKESQDSDYLDENSILKNYRWEDFVKGIKTENRFHSNYFNMERLRIFLESTKKNHYKGEFFFRARICPDKNGFPRGNMGPPTNTQSKGGRVNPMGINILYLSDSLETTLHEVRAGIYDYVCVAKFKLQKDINVIDFSSIDQISPFTGVRFGFDFLQYEINFEHLKMIAQEIAKPLRNDNALDYIPTQYISDFIRSEGYEGIEYLSTMNRGGSNLAVFDPSLFKCTQTEVYDINLIKYLYDKI